MNTPDDDAAGDDRAGRRRWLKVLRGFGLAEGVTLLFLVGIAVPMKHLAGQQGLVSAAGPVHGLVFLLYLWLAVRVAVAEGWKRGDIVRLCGVALVPFGTFLNDRFLKGKLAALAGST